LEAVLPIECEISSFQLVIEVFPNTTTKEELFLYLMKHDETRRDVDIANEMNKRRVKLQYDKYVRPRSFQEGDLVLVYHQDHDKLGEGKLDPM
jgi:hypothetical protein